MSDGTLRITAAAGSDVGKVREGNEDSYFSGRTLFAVADGMGGHQAGEVASELALEPLRRLDGRSFADASDASSALVKAIEEANEDVVNKSRSDESLRGMGTTLTAVVVHEDRLVAAHVGDSRAYLLRRGEPISQLTTDHTLVERLVQEGRLSRDEVGGHPQRNVITRAIGNEPRVSVDALPPLQLQPGDIVLLCSDGLTGPLDDAEIQTLLDATGGGQDAVDALIASANEAGGPDNITVVLVEVDGAVTDTAGDASSAASARTVVTAAPVGADDGPAEASAGSQVVDHDVRHGDTESEADRDWASTVGRLGAGARKSGEGASGTGGSSRKGRIVAGVLAAIVLLGLLVGGGYFLLSRAYFVGDHDGRVAVHRGLPETVAGIPLYWVIEDEVSDVAVSDLPAFRQEDVAEGLSAGTLREARQLVGVLRDQVEDAPSDAAGSSADPTPRATSDPGT